MQERIATSPAAFVMPFYADQECSERYLGEAIEGLFAQTDQNWKAIIVDDASPNYSAKEYLQTLEEKYSQHVTVLRRKNNGGPGQCRNIAIQWACEKNYPIILFNDSDDISHPDRLKVVREIFYAYPTVDLAYSTFEVIDEHSQLVPTERLSPSIAEIIQSLEAEPVEGYNAWIKIGTVIGFACLPSSTAVRSTIARKCPFPEERVSEDSYAWMHIAAEGNEFKFTPLVPSLYRIPSDKAGSTQRSRIGKKKFYQEKARVDRDGFFNALKIALEKGTISHEQANDLRANFFRRLIETLTKEKEAELVQIILEEWL